MPMPLSVLVVEDSEDDTLLQVRAIREAGYATDFERVETAEALDEALSRREWDIVIIDYALPRFGAIEALDILQRRGLDLPAIVVTGVIGEESAAQLMRAGAQDFVTKGNLARLVPAIERELTGAR